MTEIPVERIDAFARQLMVKSGNPGHSYEHVRRVYEISKRVGTLLNADMRVLSAAALLHDIGREREEETGISHSILSGQMGEEILKKVGFSNAEIEHVKSVIRTHRFSEGLEPDSLEGKILSDADKLDALGAIGVFRAISRASSRGDGIEGFLRHADEKLLKLRDLMYTDIAKEIAEERHSILEAFVSELRTETKAP
ncbi:MAG: HD domain-containing protein [Candidatus Hodarchaeota archaeon]